MGRLQLYQAVDKGVLKTGWDERHNSALSNPKGPEIPITTLLLGLEDYMHSYSVRFNTEIYEDGVLGDGVIDIVKGIRTLLNGETGRLDCGTIDARLVEILRKCGEEI